MKIFAAMAAVAIMAVAVVPVQAEAQGTTATVDPRLDITSVELSLSPDGNLVAQITPAQAWGNQIITDIFSWFFSINLSNDVIQASLLLQTHDGVVTSYSRLSTPTETKEVEPTIFFGPGGEWLRLVLEISLTEVIPGSQALSWLVSAATMPTPTSERAESLGYAGQFNLPTNLATADPLAGAVGKLGPNGEWLRIENPVPAVVPQPTEAPTTVPVATPKPEPTVTESAAPTSVAPAGANTGQGGAGGGAGAAAGGGGSNAFWVFSIAAFLLMITMFLYLRGHRSKRRGLEIASPTVRVEYAWDLPKELMDIFTDLTDAERREAIKDFNAVDDKKAYIEYFQAIQKFQSPFGGPFPPEKPPGI